MIEIAVLTCDTHMFLMKGFAYLFNKYWSDRQIVKLFAPMKPSFPLPPNFEFTPLKRSYPFSEWTTSVRDMLSQIENDVFIFMLEDYWLMEKVDTNSVNAIHQIMMGYWASVLRCDLTSDRYQHKQKILVDQFAGHNVFQTDPSTPYQMSFQAGIWNKHMMMNNIKPGEDAHTAEIEGSKRLAKNPKVRVYGVNPPILRYSPVYRFKRSTFDYSKLDKEDRNILDILYR